MAGGAGEILYAEIYFPAGIKQGLAAASNAASGLFIT